MFRLPREFPTGDIGSYATYVSFINITQGTADTDVPSTVVDNQAYLTVGSSDFHDFIYYDHGHANVCPAGGTHFTQSQAGGYAGLDIVDDDSVIVFKKITTSTSKTGSYFLGDFTKQFSYTTQTTRNTGITYFGVNPWFLTGGNGILFSSAGVSGQDGILRSQTNDGECVPGVPFHAQTTLLIDSTVITNQFTTASNYVNLYYEANMWGSTGPDTNSAYAAAGGIIYSFNIQSFTAIRQNEQVFKQDGAFIEYLYVVDQRTNNIENINLVTGGTANVSFNNTYREDGYSTFDFILMPATTFNTDSMYVTGPVTFAALESKTATIDLVLPMQYVDFTAGFNGFASRTKQMQFLFTDYGTATVIGGVVKFSSVDFPELSVNRETVVVPFTTQQASWKLTAGNVVTENNNFLTFFTQLGLTNYPKKVAFTYFYDSEAPPVESGAAGFTSISQAGAAAKLSFKTRHYLPISFSQLYPQVFTYDGDISAYTMHDYSDMEPRWSKYKNHVIYRNSNFSDHPAKVNLFYGLYSLYKCDAGDQTLDKTVAASGVFITQYPNTDFDVLIKYSPLIEVKKANRMFWSYPSDYFTSSQYYNGDLGSAGQVFFFNTWSVGINEGQQKFVFPVKSNKWMPPENLLDISVGDFRALTTDNTAIFTNTMARALFYPKQYVFPITVSRAYSTAEAYY